MKMLARLDIYCDDCGCWGCCEVVGEKGEEKSLAYCINRNCKMFNKRFYMPPPQMREYRKGK